MEIVTLDCETTTLNKGNPFDPRNRLCSVGILNKDGYTDFEIEYGSKPYGENLQLIREKLEGDKLIVGFNLKFDLHWLRRYIPDLSIGRVWDCQLAQYILSYQQKTFPKLNDCAAFYDLGSKLDVVANEYWAKGIDTPDVPYDILAEYLKQDVRLTYLLYNEQQNIFDGNKELLPLFHLGCEDLKWLMEAEANGLLYDVEESRRKAVALSLERDSITARLNDLYGISCIDWDSSDNVSVVLFGGTIYQQGREVYTKILKAGPVERERKAWIPVVFPRQLTPDPKSENDPVAKIKGDEVLARVNKERVEARLKPFVRTYSVAEGILRNFSPKGKVKTTIQLLLRRQELNKLISTYYEGIPKKLEEMHWDKLHGTFNQVGTKTGRLSSSNPNLQNFASIIKPLFRSAYA